MEIKKNIFSLRVWWVILFLFYFFSRAGIQYHQNPFPEKDNLYSVKQDRIRNGSYFIALDEAKYLSLARVFPSHKLFGNTFYLTHPPLFPGLIAFNSLWNDNTAQGAVFVSFFSSIGLFLVLFCLIRELGIREKTAFLTMLIFSLFELPRMYSQLIMKEELFLFLFFFSITFYLKGIKGSNRAILLSIFSGIMAVFTADQGLFLFPILLIIALIFRSEKWRLNFLLPPLFVGLAYFSWMMFRYYNYVSHDLLSCGVDGCIEPVSSFTLTQLFNPHLFPCSASVMSFRFELDIYRIIYRLNELFQLIAPLHPFSFLFQITILIVFLFTIVIFFQKLSFKNRNYGNSEIITERKAILFAFALIVISFSPMVNRGTQARMMLTALPVISLLAAIGFNNLSVIFFKKSSRRRVHFFVLITILIFSLLIGSVLYWKGSIFSLNFEFESSLTADYLEICSEKLIIAQTGYSPELVYQTQKIVVGLPCSYKVLNIFLKRNPNAIILFGEHYLTSLRANGIIFEKETIEHILSHPNTFKAIQTIKENYHTVNWPDRLYLFRYKGIPTDSKKQTGKKLKTQ